MGLFSNRRAEALHSAGVECSETGNEGKAGCLFDATKCRVEPAERRHMEVPAGPRAKQERSERGRLRITAKRSSIKACSEGRPHEGHDQELKEAASWSVERKVGFAAVDLEALKGVLGVWAAKAGRSVSEMRCTLKAGT